MMHHIDLGVTSYRDPKDRVWIIDPVDCTKAFLRGGQYVVCATLFVNGTEIVAGFGCPQVNLKIERLSEQDTDMTGDGYLISAIRGKGAQQMTLQKCSSRVTDDREEKNHPRSQHSFCKAFYRYVTSISGPSEDR
jgi:3'-phosphoadenosine 5'-phosphosulfate (PAPS) 3'-phosphatase